MNKSGPQVQRGVALVSVLLVVVIATVLSVSMVQEQKASIQTTRNFLQRGQALQYALGGEELARQILFEDFEEDAKGGPGRDHMLETWASPELHYEFEEGEVNLRIIDLQGKLNINGLAEKNPQRQTIRQRMLNLAAAVGSDPSVVDQMSDWLDADNGVRSLGAEDFEYLGLEEPYRTAGTIFADVSEVRLLLGLPGEIYYRLKPNLAALPDETAMLNVNTASAVVYQSLAPGMSYQAAQALVLRRDEEEGFESVAAFLQSSELAGLGVADVGLGVQSNFFESRVIARFQDRYSYLTSIIQRNPTDGSMRVIQRDFSRSITPPPTPESGEPISE